MIRGWARRTVELHDELAAIAEVDLRWWLLAGGVAAAEPWGARGDYVKSDAEPVADTFIGFRAPAPYDPIADAIARARAARTALRELDGELLDQRLAVTIRRAGHAIAEPTTLEVAAFACAGGCVVGALDDPTLPAQLAGALAGAPAGAPAGVEPRAWTGAAPFVCVSVGDEPIATARHGHRRAWTEAGGPWLGLGRAGELATVSTCHMVVDGYGHTRITGRIAELLARDPAHAARRPATPAIHGVYAIAPAPRPAIAPPLPAVPRAIPLGVAWRELRQPAPRALPLAYALGRALHRLAGRRDARFSPTFQIPIAPGRRDDPDRWRRRVVPAAVSLRFDRGVPEPFQTFEARVREALAREADGRGLVTRLLAAARAAPAPVAWKRRGISATRPRWLERFAEVLGGRGVLSRIGVEAPMPPACAVSSPPRLASPADPFGSCIVTVVDDGERAAITASGSGFAGTEASAGALIDELLALV